MDLNLVVLAGRAAIPVEIKVFASGSVYARILVTVRSEMPRRRVDVVPVTIWDPADEVKAIRQGDRVWVCGSAQRRFWDAPDGRRSRLEVVADQVQVLAEDWRPETGTPTTTERSSL